MRLTLTATLIIFCALAAPVASVAQTTASILTNPAEIDLSVQGIRLGSTLTDVTRTIGKPPKRSRERVTDGACPKPYVDLALRYPGLYIHVIQTGKEADAKVVGFDVTSAKWLIVPGVQIGMTENEVTNALGAPGSTKQIENTLVLHYVTPGKEGAANLFITNGKLDRAAWEGKYC